MNTRLIALPSSYDPLYDNSFQEWCDDQGIVVEFLRIGAMKDDNTWRRSSGAIWGKRITTIPVISVNNTVIPTMRQHMVWTVPAPYNWPVPTDYYVWKVIGTDTHFVAIKLRWCDELLTKWFIPEVEADMAKADGIELDEYEHL